MDIVQLKHELARQEKLNLERTVSHMYGLPESRRRCGRSCSWYSGIWSPKSSRGFVSCGTLVLVCRSRLGGSFVGSIALRLARWPVDHRTSALPTSATPHDLHTYSTDQPPVKKTMPSPLYAFATRFCNNAPTNTTLSSRSLARNHQVPVNPHISLRKARDLKGTLG